MILPHFIAKAQCYFLGHRRGRRVSNIGGLVAYSCPRCSATWTRKARKPKEAA